MAHIRKVSSGTKAPNRVTRSSTLRQMPQQHRERLPSLHWRLQRGPRLPRGRSSGLPRSCDLAPRQRQTPAGPRCLDHLRRLTRGLYRGLDGLRERMGRCRCPARGSRGVVGRNPARASACNVCGSLWTCARTGPIIPASVFPTDK